MPNYANYDFGFQTLKNGFKGLEPRLLLRSFRHDQGRALIQTKTICDTVSSSERLLFKL